jgi:hypothetical protein
MKVGMNCAPRMLIEWIFHACERYCGTTRCRRTMGEDALVLMSARREAPIDFLSLFGCRRFAYSCCRWCSFSRSSIASLRCQSRQKPKFALRLLTSSVLFAHSLLSTNQFPVGQKHTRTSTFDVISSQNPPEPEI